VNTRPAADRGDVPAVDVTGLSKRFGERHVVSDLSFRVAPGRAFGLLGPNGSGKTTTVRMLNGLLTPDAGSIRLFGQPVEPGRSDALRARVGVQTDTNLYETLSAAENLRIWGSLYGMDRARRDRRITEVLDVLGLAERSESLVGEFSKGMRQKLAVGRAVLHEPELLFLDEPTAGLDPEAAADLIDYLKQMITASNTTVIICTHQLHGLESLCDDMGIIRRGRLLTAGAVDDLLRERWPERRVHIGIAASAAPDVRAEAERVIAEVAGRAPVADESGRFELSADEETVAAVVAALVRAGAPVVEVAPQQPTIEDFYFATLAEGAE